MTDINRRDFLRLAGGGVAGAAMLAIGPGVAQCVREADIPRHVGRWSADERSISIEHAGYRSKRWTDAQYRASARLTASICRRNKIPVDSQHVVKHKHIYSGTTCPGRHFDLDRYVELVKRYRRSM